MNKPSFGFLVIDAADFVAFEDREVFVHGVGRLKPDVKLGSLESVHQNSIDVSVGVKRELCMRTRNGRAE